MPRTRHENRQHPFLSAALILGAAVLPAEAGLLFSEDFGDLANGTLITTGNTDLTYVRVGTGTGAALSAVNPGSFGGASVSLLATSTSLTGVGVLNETYSPFAAGTFSFSIKPGADSTFIATLGTGTTFSNNSGFSTAQLTAGFQLTTAGSLNTRAGGAWVSTGITLTAGIGYDLEIVFNGSGDALAYGFGESVDAGTADIWVDGELLAEGVSIEDAVDVSAFRLYATGGAGSSPVEIDNIALFDSVPPGIVVPEPGTGALAALGVGGLLLARRRRA